MRALIISLLIIGFFSCHPGQHTDRRIEQYLNDPSMSLDDALFEPNSQSLAAMWLLSQAQDSLSATAQENFKNFVVKRADLRKKMMEICGISSAISDSDKEAINKIKNDQTLSAEDKKTKIKEVILPLHAQIIKNREAIRACKKDKLDALKPYLEQRAALKFACLASVNKDAKKEIDVSDKNQRRGHKLEALSDEEKAALNAKLESKACTDALAK